MCATVRAVPARRHPTPPSRQIRYALERLYNDHEPDWVVDTIPALLAWVQGASSHLRQPCRFALAYAASPGGPLHPIELALRWNLNALRAHDPSVRAHLERMRSGRTAQREHVVELAAYGLALVAIAVLLPGRRVIAMGTYERPDLLFDTTAGALAGVEVAGRTTGGRRILASVRAEKLPLLQQAPDLAEVYLSLWCASPRVADFRKVKP